MSKQENNITLMYMGPLIVIGLALMCFVVPYLYVALPMVGLIVDARTGRFSGSATVILLATAVTIMVGIDIMPLTLPLILVTIAALVLLNKGIAPMESLVLTAAMAVASLAGGMYILSLVRGMNITTYLIMLSVDWLKAIPETGAAHYMLSTIALALNGIEGGSLNLGETLDSVMEFQNYSTTALVGLVEPYVESMVKYNIPGMVVKTSLYMGVLSYGVPAYAAKLWRAKGRELSLVVNKTPDLPRFKDWDLPRWIKLPILITMFISVIAQFASNEEVVVVISLTINSLVMGIGAIEGLALINFWLEKKKMRVGGMIALMTLAFVLFGTLVSYLGLFDMVTGLRRFWKARETLIKEIKTKIDKNDSDEEKKK